MDEKKKLELNRETLRELTVEQRRSVVGGNGPTVNPCNFHEDPSENTCTAPIPSSPEAGCSNTDPDTLDC